MSYVSFYSAMLAISPHLSQLEENCNAKWNEKRGIFSVSLHMSYENASCKETSLVAWSQNDGVCRRKVRWEVINLSNKQYASWVLADVKLWSYENMCEI